jgi:gluconate 2-dehydrogenase gamma chain
MVEISRRALIQGTGSVGATMLPIAGAAPAPEGGEHGNAWSSFEDTTRPSQRKPTYLFFNADEAAFIEAAVARLIPKDDQWEAG